MHGLEVDIVYTHTLQFKERTGYNLAHCRWYLLHLSSVKGIIFEWSCSFYSFSQIHAGQFLEFLIIFLKFCRKIMCGANFNPILLVIPMIKFRQNPHSMLVCSGGSKILKWGKTGPYSVKYGPQNIKDKHQLIRISLHQLVFQLQTFGTCFSMLYEMNCCNRYFTSEILLYFCPFECTDSGRWQCYAQTVPYDI